MLNLTITAGSHRAAAALIAAAFLVLNPNAATSGVSTKAVNSYAHKDSTPADDLAPRIDTDGAGTWGGLWMSPWLTNPAGGGVKFSLSNDTGATWGANSGHTLMPGHNMISADVAYAGNNKWVIMGISEDPASPNAFRKVSFIVTNGDQPTINPKVLTQAASSQPFPFNQLQVVSDGNGKLLAKWLQFSEGVRYDLVFSHSTDYGQTWSVPADGYGIYPNYDRRGKDAKIAYAGDGMWVIVYTFADVDGRNTNAVAQSDNMGVSWNTVGRLYRGTASDFEESLFDIAARDGKVVIASMNVSDPRPPGGMAYSVAIYNSNDSGTTFTGPLWVPRSTWNSIPSLATDASGNWLLSISPNDTRFTDDNVSIWKSSSPETTWTLSNVVPQIGNTNAVVAGSGNGEFVLLTEHYDSPATFFNADVDIMSLGTDDNGTTWSAPVYVNSSAASDLGKVHDTGHDIDAAENIVMASWLTNFTYPPGISSSSTVMVSRSFDHGKTWGPAMEIPGSFLMDYSGTWLNTSIRHISPGTWECTWQVSNWSPYTYKKVKSIDDGLTWSAPVAVEGLPVRDPSVASDGSGNMVRARSETIFDSNTRTDTVNTYTELSTDSGATWHSKVNVLSESGPFMQWTSQNRDEPAVVYLGDMRFAVLVQNIFEGRDLPYDVNRLQTFNLYIAESSNGGNTWSIPTPVVKTSRATQRYEATLTAAGNNIIVGWQKGETPGIYGSQDEGDIYAWTKRFGNPTAARDWSLFD